MTLSKFISLARAHVQAHSEYIPGPLQDESAVAFVRAAECGGVSGGSCWESSNPQPYQTEVSDPGLGKVLDSFLEAHCPTLTFLQYRKLSQAIQVGSHSDRGYYGNRTDYTVWTLTFEDAWAVLEPFLAKTSVDDAA